MRALKIQTLGLALLVVAASAATAIACPNNDKSASTASYTSAGKGECAAHSSTMTADAKGNCPATKDCPAGACPYSGKTTSAVAASAEHGSCGMSKSAMAASGCSMHGASAGDCAFGKNTVTMSGAACPVGHEADYAFMVKGADCKGMSETAVKAIKSLKGVSSVTVDYKNHMAYVCADSRTATQTAIAGTLKKAGFDAVKFVSQDKANCAKSHGKVEA